jgi:ubiquinone/menaquinone biosynthesis C-methylase UbiE
MKQPLFDYLLSQLDLSANNPASILDFGCGMGDFLGLVSNKVTADSKLLGIDASMQFIREASSRYPGIRFICNKFNGKLELPDASFDLITTIDVIECISDKNALLNEFHRVLKPHGKLLAVHWDWDTMIYSTEENKIARKAVAAFSDWKQPWMDHCDGQMGRKLWGLFEGSKKFQGKPNSFTLIETKYEKGKYGFDRMQDIAKIVGKGMIKKEEQQRLHLNLINNNADRKYFFSVTSFIYYGVKL